MTKQRIAELRELYDLGDTHSHNMKLAEAIPELLAEIERLRAALEEVKTRIIDNPKYSSQMAQAIFQEIAGKALEEE